MDEQLQLSSIVGENAILDIDVQDTRSSYIKVVGVGGAGTNAVNHMYNKGINGVDLFVCNTDATSLNASPVKNKVSIGQLGAGNDAKRGRKAAEENQEEIKGIFDANTRMLFVTAGMGGGTGTGASPVVAKLAKDVLLPDEEEDILVVGVVTLPFSFEGRKRRKQAEDGINELKEYVDCMIIVNTDKLLAHKDLQITDAFALADDVLFTAVKGISEIMTNTGHVQVDFRDVQSVMKNSGVALMGMGIAEGENRALEAVKAATTSELLNDNDISQTKNVLLTFTCSSEAAVTMEEMCVIQEYIAEQTNEDVDLIWGFTKDESFGGKLGITFIATGFEYKDIYTPTTRTPKHEGSVPSPEKASIETTTESINTTPTATQPQTAKPNEGLENIVVINKAPQQEQQTEQTASNAGKTIIRVDEHANPINQNTNQVLQTAESFPQRSESVYGDIIMKQPTAFRQVEEIETKQEQLISTVAQSVYTEPQTPLYDPQPQQHINATGLKDAIRGGVSLEDEEAAQIREIAPKDFANKWERIRKYREQMNTPEGLEQIINSHPTPDNNFDCSYSFSSPKQQASLSVNNAGNVEVRSNFAIDSQVD